MFVSKATIHVYKLQDSPVPKAAYRIERINIKILDYEKSVVITYGLYLLMLGNVINNKYCFLIIVKKMDGVILTKRIVC